jgi:alpha-glucosidase
MANLFKNAHPSWTKPGLLISSLILALSNPGIASPGDYRSHHRVNDQIVIVGTSGQIIARPYGNSMLRIQHLRDREAPFDDNHYEMIERHDFGGNLDIRDAGESLEIRFTDQSEFVLRVEKKSLLLSFENQANGTTYLKEKAGLVASHDKLVLDFQPDPSERFIGFGQKPLGYQDYLELTGRTERRNYSEDHIEGRGAQGNLLVPFYLSSKGYGLFLNSTFPNQFAFNDAGAYSLTLETMGFDARMDFVFIFGNSFAEMLDHYTQLTGRPRMIPLSMFGLQLSDNDPRLEDNQKIGENWWKTMVTRHREAGLPIDHLVFDNDWRMGSGGWSGSWFEFNKELYPHPPAFREWLESQGLTLTLDLNLNNCNDSAFWDPAFNLTPSLPCEDVNGDSYPDYTRRDVRRWNWEMFWEMALNPSKGYPGDGLWMDESDGIWTQCVPLDTLCGNGRSWLEMKNYYYFLIAKAITEEGWLGKNDDFPHAIGPSKRPYVWVRGGTAGGQRLHTHWTGDIHFQPSSMQAQVVSMQASGLAGYPYFNHDAGGFVEETPGPDDATYVQWAMAFGSFTPIWRPHGYGLPRWPTNRSELCQKYALKYGKLRYEMMPYIYSMAHVANRTGMPMARPLMLAYPEESEAWKHPLQYLWGDSMLVIPNTELTMEDTQLEIWLPPHAKWYHFWNHETVAGGQKVTHHAPFGELPVYVKAGAIITKRPYAQSTFWLSDEDLHLDVYVGCDGDTVLIEDDGVSESYKVGQVRETGIEWNESSQTLIVHPAAGTYAGASTQRNYRIRFIGVPSTTTVEATCGGETLSPEAINIKHTAGLRTTTVTLPALPATQALSLKLNTP